MNRKIRKNPEIYDRACEALSVIPFSKEAIRLKAIMALKDHSLKMVTEIFGFRPQTLRKWVSRFADEGLEGLKNKPRKPRASKLDERQVKTLVELALREGENITLLKLRHEIRERFGVSISLPGIWKILKKEGLSHITSRSVHYKQDPENVTLFKKNSQN